MAQLQEHHLTTSTTSSRYHNDWESIHSPSGIPGYVEGPGQIFSWGLELQQRRKDDFFLNACVGIPTTPVFPPYREAIKEYWTDIIGKDDAITYGCLQGDIEFREMLAKGLTRQYDVEITKDDVMFTSGGKIALHALQEICGLLYPSQYNVVTLPLYPTYFTTANPMLFVDMMKYGGKLTPQGLRESLQNIPCDQIGSFWLNNPNNPMGTVISSIEEWNEIINQFEEYPKALIILDEAYFELVYGRKHLSLVSVAPPHILEPIVLLRSATKGFAISGERIACVMTKNQIVMDKLITYHDRLVIHSPRSIQFAYAKAMDIFSEKDSIPLAAKYEKKVRFFEFLLAKHGFSYVPEDVRCNTALHHNEEFESHIQAGFYCIGDFSRFKNHLLYPEALSLFTGSHNGFIETDVDIALHLMFVYSMCFMPMSLFGIDPKQCLIRITCCYQGVSDESHIGNRFDQMTKDLTLLED